MMINRRQYLIPTLALALSLFVFMAIAAPVAPSQTLKVLYSFTGNSDGGQPYAKLVVDPAGNGYGTTAVGGDITQCNAIGCGVIFKLTRTGQYQVLYTFEGGPDGNNPWSGLLRDSAGNLYGTTEAGGTAGYGTVYKLDPTGIKLCCTTSKADRTAPIRSAH